MPVAELGGIEIAYELVGAGQPWVITPGGQVKVTTPPQQALVRLVV